MIFPGNRGQQIGSTFRRLRQLQIDVVYTRFYRVRFRFTPRTRRGSNGRTDDDLDTDRNSR